jgi:hypothetical protein
VENICISTRQPRARGHHSKSSYRPWPQFPYNITIPRGPLCLQLSQEPPSPLFLSDLLGHPVHKNEFKFHFNSTSVQDQIFIVSNVQSPSSTNSTRPISHNFQISSQVNVAMAINPKEFHQYALCILQVSYIKYGKGICKMSPMPRSRVCSMCYCRIYKKNPQRQLLVNLYEIFRPYQF